MNWIRKDNEKAENWNYVSDVSGDGDNSVIHGSVARIFNAFLFKPFDADQIPLAGLFDYSTATKIVEDNYARKNPVNTGNTGKQRFLRTTDKFTSDPPNWDKYAFTVHLCDSKRAKSFSEICDAHTMYAIDFMEPRYLDGEIAIALVMAIEAGVITVVGE